MYALTEDKRVSGPHIGTIVSLHDLRSNSPYGFLKTDQSEHDVYFSFNDIESGTAQRLRRGNIVDFILYRISDDARRGLRAKVRYITKHTIEIIRPIWPRQVEVRRRRDTGITESKNPTWKPRGRLVKLQTSKIAKGPDETRGFKFVRNVANNEEQNT